MHNKKKTIIMGDDVTSHKKNVSVPLEGEGHRIIYCLNNRKETIHNERTGQHREKTNQILY